MKILDKIKQVFRNGFFAFKTFPLVIIFAAVFTLITYIRIADVTLFVQESVLDTIQLSIALTISINLFLVSNANKNNKSNLWANVITGIVFVATSLWLYFFGQSNDYYTFTALAYLRVSSLSFIAILLFVYSNKGESDYASAFFMTVKAFVVAFVYGMVLFLGASATIGAFQALIYNDLSYDVYSYVGATILFISVTIFTGYFPNIKDLSDPRHNEVRGYPKFARVLIESIMGVIFFALSVVLILWSAKTLITSDWPDFIEVQVIVMSYILFGFFLYMLNVPHDTPIGKWFKKLFPILGLIIIAFGVRVMFVELPEDGLTTSLYAYILTMLGSIVALVVLLIKGKKSHEIIVASLIVCLLISIAPLINSIEFVFNVQMHKLESYLIEHEVLIDEKIVPNEDLPITQRYEITKLVYKLARSRNQEFPTWFDEDLDSNEVFTKTFGFAPRWQLEDYDDDIYTYFFDDDDIINIEGYHYLFNAEKKYGNVNFDDYVLDYTSDDQFIKIYKGETLLFDVDMKAVIHDEIDRFYIKDNNRESVDLSFEVENDGFKIMVVLERLEFKNEEIDRFYYQDIFIQVKE